MWNDSVVVIRSFYLKKYHPVYLEVVTGVGIKTVVHKTAVKPNTDFTSDLKPYMVQLSTQC